MKFFLVKIAIDFAIFAAAHSINMADETRRGGRLGEKNQFFIEKVTLFYSQAKEVYNFHMARALDTMLFGDVLLCNFQLTKFFVLFEDTKLFKGLVETGRLILLEAVQ